MVPVFSQDTTTADMCRLTNARRSENLLAAPNILIVHLRRYNKGLAKVNQHISLGKPELDLSKYLLDGSPDQSAQAMYQLHGMVVHRGESRVTGHYIAYVVDSGKSTLLWMLCCHMPHDHQIAPACL